MTFVGFNTIIIACCRRCLFAVVVAAVIVVLTFVCVCFFFLIIGISIIQIIFKDVSREFDEFQVNTHLCKLRCWYS